MSSCSITSIASKLSSPTRELSRPLQVTCPVTLSSTRQTSNALYSAITASKSSSMAYIPPPRKPARPNLPSPRLDIPLKRPAGPVPVLSSQSLPTLSIPSRTRDEPATTPSSEDALSSARTMPASFLDDGGYDDLEGVSTVRRNDQIQQAIASLSLGPSSNEGSSSASPTTSIRSDQLARHASNGSGTAATDIGGLRWTEADLEDLGGLGAGALPWPSPLASVAGLNTHRRFWRGKEGAV